MKSLELELEEEFNKNRKKLPNFIVNQITKSIEANGAEANPMQVGDRLADGKLINHLGERFVISELLDGKPAIINFYRGAWCPYCNLELRHYDKLLALPSNKDIKMFMISPEKPDETMETIDIEKLNFNVLSDVDNKFAEKLGLVHKISKKVKLLYKAKGVNLKKSQGNDNEEQPLAATYVIDHRGVITAAWLDTNFTKRAEPIEVIEAYKQLID